MGRFTAHLKGSPEIGVYRMKRREHYVAATDDQYAALRDSSVSELLPTLDEKDVERISELHWSAPVVFKYRPGLFG